MAPADGVASRKVAVKPRTRATARRQPSSSRCRSVAGHGGLEAPLQAPGCGDLVQRAVDAGGEPGEVGGTQGRGLDHRRPLDRAVQHVGQELAQPVVDHHAAVDPQRAELRRRGAALHVGDDRVGEVGGLVGHGLERGAGDVARRRCRGSGPRMAPRASGSQCGAPRPVKAGTR